jgi:hypothetical protein
MPVACSTSALTGQEGSIYFQPAGTRFCLLDHTDFPAGDDITVPSNHDYKVGDPIVFNEEGTASIDTAITAGETVFVVATTETTIQVSATAGGTAITLNGDGGTGAQDTAGAANHISVAYAEFAAICAVREFSVSIERESLDVTTLPCGVGAGGGKYAAFRRTQAGYGSGTGSMTVYFSDSQVSLANRLQGNVLLKSQEGARVRLFVNTVSDGAATPAPDLQDSLYLEADISINSMSLSVNPDDATTGELEFSILNPTHILGADLT